MINEHERLYDSVYGKAYKSLSEMKYTLDVYVIKKGVKVVGGKYPRDDNGYIIGVEKPISNYIEKRLNRLAALADFLSHTDKYIEALKYKTKSGRQREKPSSNRQSLNHPYTGLDVLRRFSTDETMVQNSIERIKSKNGSIPMSYISAAFALKNKLPISKVLANECVRILTYANMDQKYK